MNTAGLVVPLLAAAVLSGLIAKSAHCKGLVNLPKNAEVRAMQSDSPTLIWAVERVAKELQSVHSMEVVQISDASNPVDDANDKMQIILGAQGKHQLLDSWTKEQGIKPVTDEPGSNAYRVTILQNPLRVVIIGSDDMGAWYGACEWMDSLIRSAASGAGMPLDEISWKPELSIRFTRGVRSVPVPDEKVEGVADYIPEIDWWARWRMNATVVNEASPDYLADLQKRGIRVLIHLRVRRMCAADDEQVADLVAAADRFFKSGGDGVYMLWDDLPDERSFGHCDRCREKFGPQSLPHEHVHVVEAVCDAAAKYSDDKLIVWCPSHYSRSRYKDFSDEDFYRVIGASKTVREQSYMFHCEFDPTYTEVLDRFGVNKRVFWYNGLRPIYYMLYLHTPAHLALKKVEHIDGFGGWDFPHFDTGWFTGTSWDEDGNIVYAGEGVWNDLRSLSERYQGFYLCGPSTAYANALVGLYSISPSTFTKEEADIITFGALFGPGSHTSARRWSDDYNYLQAFLAKRAERKLTDTEKRQAEQILDRMKEDRKVVEASAAARRTTLSRSILEHELLLIRDGEKAMERIIQLLSEGSSDK